MIYRYYLKEGDEVKTVDSETLPQEFSQKDIPELTLAMLASSFKEDMFERSKQFLITQGFLIRTPIFTDKSGKEHEGKNDEYKFTKRGNGYFYCRRPSQSAEILHNATKGDFDISTSGGSGFSQNNRFFFDGVKKNPQDFIGKKKPRIFAFSNIFNSTILQDFFDYVHSVPLQLRRRAIAINDVALYLVSKLGESKLQIRSYPLNLGKFFHNQYNSNFAFIPPRKNTACY